MFHPNTQKVKQKCQDALKDEQGAPGWTPTSKGSTERWPRGKTAMLFWACMDSLRKAKAAGRDYNNDELFNEELRDISNSSALVLVEDFNFPGINWLVSYSRHKQLQEIAEAHGG